MSGLDIEPLRLTEEEKAVGGLYSIHSQQRDYVADAQLAKALDGFEVWLRNRWMDGATFSDVIGDLEQANIKRPTGPS